MAKYSKGAQKSVESSMKRMEKGKLESGKSGKKVTNPKQAIAIGLSEARKKGAKVPAKKTAAKSASPTKSAAKKAAPKKAAAKKIASVKKTAAKAPVKKSAPKKAATKSAAPKKSAAKKTAPKKSAAKKSISKKAAVPKKAAAKKTAPQKVTAKRSVPQKPTAAKEVFADKNLTEKINTNENASFPEYNETIGKVANINHSNDSEKSNAGDNGMADDGLKAPEKVEDPITAADTKAYNKATTQGDPHQKLHLSSAKGGIKPSGKKPLWNR